jgi:hypothetical protein
VKDKLKVETLKQIKFMQKKQFRSKEIYLSKELKKLPFMELSAFPESFCLSTWSCPYKL